jgi:hypothetical protein
MIGDPLGSRDRLRLAALTVAGLTALIVGGTYLVAALDAAAELGGWAIIAWAFSAAAGALIAEYLLIRIGFRGNRPRRKDQP